MKMLENLLSFNDSSIVGMFFVSVYIWLFVLGMVIGWVIYGLIYRKFFMAAGYEGYVAFIPFVNTWIYAQISFGRAFGFISFIPFILSFVPYIGGLLSIIVGLYINYKFAQAFGKYGASRLLYTLFPLLMGLIWIVAGDYKYVGTPRNFFLG